MSVRDCSESVVSERDASPCAKLSTFIDNTPLAPPPAVATPSALAVQGGCSE